MVVSHKVISLYAMN